MQGPNQLYCTFRLADGWYGLPIEDVKEVTAETKCTRIPHAPVEVAGYVNIRGHIFLALDMRRLLGIESRPTCESRLILFKQAVGPAFGVLADEIGDIAQVNASQMESFFREGHEAIAGQPILRDNLISKVCKLPAELLIVLEPRKFLGVIEQSLSATD